MDIYCVGTYLISSEGWEGAEHYPVYGIGIGCLVVEESGVESESASIDTSPITEVNSMDTHHLGTYPIPLESWEGAEHYAVDRIGIGCLVVEVSGIESKGTRVVSSLNICRTGTYHTSLCSWKVAEQCPVDRIGIGHLVEIGRASCRERVE